MKIVCLLIAIVVGVRAQGHESLEIEIQCLNQLNMTMLEVLPYVHKITDPSDNEDVGEFLACAWQGRNIIGPDGRVNGEYVAQYLIDIYKNITNEQKNQIREESKQCEKLKSNKLSALGIKVKNCIIIAADIVGIS
ncbi:hypothetical protein FQR65_LT03172 [Abscondita terminalis]|nr:hypothetical protein FQR65_LT03172 [Abscondita terminalis]